ncbi:Rab proteins geranylgeranyltransferase component A 2 [Oryzias melastigma]|uniref:Rab proteins geranylgeranyltransferase component A n=1 Tax=Oryzias melastigma TaxID=30732 RepID=A0A834FT47_ORYME|nr:Rab proteins geranylgeranyltransferase component A 2 [Oryzias melastigma]
MAAEDLPSEFDVVILGTGLTESVVAAACSRVGQRVLHLDRRSYYAANWASFTFNALLTWIQEQQEGPQPEQVQDWSSLLEEGEELIHLSNPDLDSITNIQVVSYASEEEEEVPDTTKEETSADGPLEAESADSREEESAEAEEESAEAEEESAEKEAESAETEAESAEKEAESAEAEEESAEKEAESAEAEEKEQATKLKGEEPEEDQSHPVSASGQSEPTRKKISYAQLVKEGRRFNIDLVSKLLFSRGSLVDLLIRSNVSRYTEFKNVTRILTYRHGNLEQVPCSRADVFASRQLSVVEKRKLMRFLTSCMEETETEQAYSSHPYSKFLQDQQLGDNLQHFLLHSIAMVTEDTPTEAGLAATRHFLRSLGRYGNSPFLFPVYGLGEIPQCFCRMSAVFGGIYCLRHSVSCLIVDDNRCKAVIDSRGQRISCSHFVVEDGYLGSMRTVTTATRLLSRAVLITDSSVLSSDSEQQVSMVTIPPGEACQSAVKMVELCSSTMTCMPGTYLVHLTCQSVSSAFDDLSQLVTRMFHTPESQEPAGRPAVLWSLYFNMVDGTVPRVEGQGLPSNVHVCSGPEGSLDHEQNIKQAELIFQKIVPDEEFCPPAPNPEDIIYDGEGPTPSAEEQDSVKEAGLQEESGEDLSPQLEQ